MKPKTNKKKLQQYKNKQINQTNSKACNKITRIKYGL